MTSDGSAPSDGFALDAGLLAPVRAGARVEALTSDQAWVRAMLEAEAALARAQAAAGLVPDETAALIARTAADLEVDVPALARRARRSANPVVPLVSDLRRAVGGTAAAHVHLGATSQDILDTAAMLIARRSVAVILADLDGVMASLARLAERHRTTVMAARTLGQQAVPTTFGLKAATWLIGVLRARDRLATVPLPAQLGGAAGTLAALTEPTTPPTATQPPSTPPTPNPPATPASTESGRVPGFPTPGPPGPSGASAESGRVPGFPTPGPPGPSGASAESGRAPGSPAGGESGASAVSAGLGSSSGPPTPGPPGTSGASAESGWAPGSPAGGESGASAVSGEWGSSSGPPAPGPLDPSAVSAEGGRVSGSPAPAAPEQFGEGWGVGGGAVRALRVVELFAGETGLAVPAVPWHAERSVVGELGAALAGVTAALGKIAADVVLLSQTEVGEVAEASPGGSSAMPHKRNPALSVLVRAASLQVPAYAHVLAQVGEYERAAGAWQAEWSPLRECLRLTGGAAETAGELAAGLQVFPGRMRANAALTGGRIVSERLAAHLGRDALTEMLQRDGPLEADAGLLDPAGYLGAAPALTDRVLAAYRETAAYRDRAAYQDREGNP